MPPKQGYFFESYSGKTFSVCKKLLDVLDIELEFTESEIERNWYIKGNRHV